MAKNGKHTAQNSKAQNTETESAVAPVTAQSEDNHVLRLVTKAGKTLSNIIATLINKASEVDAGPITVLETLREIFNDVDGEGNEIDHISEEFPRLNTSSIEGDDNFVKTNAYCEVYEGGKRVNGEMKTKRLNFFTEFWADTDEGKAQHFVLKQCQMALSNNDAAKAEKLYRDMPRSQVENLVKKTKRNMARGRTYLRKAVGCWYVMIDLAAITDKKGNNIVTLEPSENSATMNSFPYDLINVAKGGRVFRPMMVSDILRLDVKKALAEGGDLYDELVKQLSRGSETQKNKYPICENPEMAYNAIAAFVQYIDGDKQNGSIKAILERMANKKKGGEEFIMMWGAGLSALKACWNPALDNRYQKNLMKEIEHGDDDNTPAQQAVAS